MAGKGAMNLTARSNNSGMPKMEASESRAPVVDMLTMRQLMGRAALVKISAGMSTGALAMWRRLSTPPYPVASRFPNDILCMCLLVPMSGARFSSESVRRRWLHRMLGRPAGSDPADAAARVWRPAPLAAGGLRGVQRPAGCDAAGGLGMNMLDLLAGPLVAHANLFRPCADVFCRFRPV